MLVLFMSASNCIITNQLIPICTKTVENCLVKIPLQFFLLFSKCHYSGTPPYDHPVNTTTSLLRPLYSDPKKSSLSHFPI